jgi:hypothetical protein
VTLQTALNVTKVFLISNLARYVLEVRKVKIRVEETVEDL